MRLSPRLAHPRRRLQWLLFAFVVWCGVAYAARQRSYSESRERYPSHGGKALALREGRGGDLHGNIPADRPLSPEDRRLVLDLSDFLIDKQNDSGPREWAAKDLGYLGHRYGIPALLAVLRDESDEFGVRQRAVIALSMIRDKRAVRYLIEGGLGSGDKGIGEQTLWELVQFAGGPNELRDKFYVSGFKPPPRAQKERKEYLKTWLDWWAAKQDEIDLERVERFAY